MALIMAPQIIYVSTGDVRVGGADYTNELTSGVSITGTPTVTEQGTSHLTIASVQATTAAMTILNRSVTAGQALTWVVSGFVAGTTYTLKASVVTDASPAETINRGFRFICQ